MEGDSDNGGSAKAFHRLSYEILRQNCANTQKKKTLNFGKEMVKMSTLTVTRCTHFNSYF